MNKYLRWFLFSFAFLLLASLVSAGVFMKYYLSPMAKDFIEEKGSSYLRAPLTVEGVSLALFPNVRATLGGVQFTIPEKNLKAKIKRVHLSVNAGILRILQGGSLGGVVIELDAPEVSLTYPPGSHDEGTKATEPIDLNSSSPFLAQDLALSLKVRQGTIRITQKPAEIILQRFELSLDTPSLFSKAFEFAVSSASFYKNDQMQLALPFQFRGSTAFQNQVLSLQKTQGEIAGLSLQLKGQQNLTTQAADWTLQAEIPELAQLPMPPAFLPSGKWTGKIAATLHAKSEGQDKGWLVGGRLSAMGLKGDTELTHEDLKAKGQLIGKADLSFSAALPEKGSLAYRIDRADLALDLAGMSLEKPGVIAKPVGVPLALAFFGSGTEKMIKVDQLNLRFANAQIQAHGTVHQTPGQISDLSLQLAKTALNGFEAYFPALAKSPLKGSIQLNAKIQGDFDKSESLTVQLKPLLLEKFEGTIDWKSKDESQTVAGVALVDGSFNLETLGQELKSADFRLTADLSGLSIHSKEKFRKEKNYPLRLNLTASQAGQMINIRSGSLLLGSNALNVSGQISNPQQPKLALKISSANLNMSELSNHFETLSKWNLTGAARGNLALNGVYDFKKGLKESALSLTGELSANLPRLVISKPDPNAKGAAAEAETKKPEPLLPSWPIAQNAIVKATLLLGELRYGEELLINGVKAQATLNKGILESTASIEKLFSGSATVSKLMLKLNESQPDLWLDADLRTLEISSALSFFAKDWQEAIKGTVSGKISVQSPHPSRADFLDFLRAQGSLNFKNAFLSTQQLDQAINSALVKTPGLGASTAPLQTKGIAADLLTNFRLDKKTINLSRFVFLTPERNELQAQGSLGLDMNVELTGTAYLTNPPIGGAIRAANSDASGRFVLPLKIKGNLMKPEVQLAEGTIAELLKKTLTTEIQKKGLDTLKGVIGQ